MKKIASAGLMLLTGPLAQAQQTPSVRVFPDILIIVLLVILCILVVFDMLARRRRPEDSDAYRRISSENDRLLEESNANKVRADEAKERLAKQETLLEQKQSMVQQLDNRITKYEASDDQRNKEAESKINQLEESRKSLERERQRVIDEETKQRKEAEESRTRIWATHEDNAKQFMAEICRKPDIALTTFDNKNPPEDFDPSFRPDFMVRLLQQYVIFDPKSSTSANIHTYLAGQAKATANKISRSSSGTEIYKTVFFVIPGIAIPDLTESYYLENGISFYVIPIEAFEPIIRTLKRLEEYDLADKYDPQERENIVTVLASFANHIREQNATNILTTIRGLQALATQQSMPEDVVNEIEIRRRKIRISSISQAQLKKLMNNPDVQTDELRKLIAPQAPLVDYEDCQAT